MANEFESVQTNLPPTVSAGWNDPPELPPVQATSATANRLKQMRTTTRPVHPSINDSSCSRYLAYSTPGTANWTPYSSTSSSFVSQPTTLDHQNYTYPQNSVPHNVVNQQPYSQNIAPNYLDGYGSATWYH